MSDSTGNGAPQSRSLSAAEREALFKRLHLAHMRRIYQEVAVQAEKEGWSYADFLIRGRGGGKKANSSATPDAQRPVSFSQDH